MIGGMSWVSTHRYYERINRQVQKEVGAPASAPLLIESLDFSQLCRLESPEDWDRGAEVLISSANRLAGAGAEQIIICANSMHKVYRQVQEQVEVPILHIAECVGKQMAADGAEQAVLMGSRNVMTESFYRRRLVAHGVHLMPPEMVDVDELDRIIYEELMVGKVRKDSERALKTMLVRYENNGAKAIILANTELELLMDVNANVLPIYDCMRIHADAAAEWIIGG